MAASRKIFSASLVVLTSFSLLFSTSPALARKKTAEEKAQAKKERQERKEARREIREANKSIPMGKLKRNDKREDALAALIASEEKELQELIAKKGQECSDPAQPCLYDEVIKAAQLELDELKDEAARVAAKEENLCKVAKERLNARDERWTKIVNDLQPLKDRITQKKALIESLKNTKRDADKKFKDEFEQAIKANQKELETLQKEFRQKYAAAAGPSLEAVPSFNKARLKLARIQFKKGRVATLCEDPAPANNEQNAAAPPEGQDSNREPASDNNSGQGNL